MSGPPRLTVSTQPPSTPGASSSSSSNTVPTRRPQGARRRGLGTGLFIANPDESDGEGDSPRSAGGVAPGSRSPITSGSSSSSKAAVPVGIAGGDGSGSPSSSRALASSAASSYNHPATIPAPQSTPLPSSSTFSPHQTQAHPNPLASPITPHSSDAASLLSPGGGIAPQPPPQPERHLRRAFTTPGPAEPASRPSVSTAGIANAAVAGPSSPNRHRPPLPSPPPVSTASASSRPSPSSAHSLPLPPPQTMAPPYPVPPPPSDSRLASPLANKRTDSPEALLSPAVASEGGRSFASVGSSESIGRARSGSNAGQKKVLQVTMDNEQFTIVDITGMNTAEAIMERVFSKLRFRDDDYSTLSLYRTDIGEAADPTPISKDTLLHLCATEGDSRASLKFLVLQTGVPGASSASVVPPLHAPDTESRYRGESLISPSNDFGPRRTPSRHSKDGSLSSTSEVLERGGVLGSDWSDLGQEADDAQSTGGSALQRSRRSVRVHPSARPIGSNGSQTTSSPSLPTPASTTHLPLVDIPSRHSPGPEPVSPVSPVRAQETRKGTMTPTPNRDMYPVAGPSRRTTGLELQTDDMIDAGTAALIAQFTRENQAAMQAELQRKRQLEADEEFARREQQSERDVWQMMQQMQLEQRRREQEQIENDERQARQVEAEERRRVEEEERRARVEREQREQRERQQQQQRQQAQAQQQQQQQQPPQAQLSQSNRGASFSQDRRQLRQEWQNRGGQGEIGTVLPALGDGPYPPRRPSDGYPSGTLFDEQIYTSPAQQFSAEVPTYTAPRRPTGFASGRYEEEQHAQERLNDPRLQHVGSRTMPRRGQPRHPYLYGREDAYRGQLGNAKSMDNLRPLDTQPPVSRPPYQGIPPRSSITPNPSGEYPYRERSQDGRYPGVSPHHVSSPSASVPPGSGFMQFPSPRPSGSGTWTGFPMEAPRRPSWERQGSSPRPSSLHDHNTPTVHLEAPRRPTTYHDDSPPHASHTVTGEYFHPNPQYASNRPRSGSGSIVRARSPNADLRRASESSAYDEREYPQDVSPPSTWLAVPRSARRDTSDTASNAGTVSSGVSESTVRPRGKDDEESADTVKAGDLASQWSAMVAHGRDENASYRALSSSAVDDDEDDEDDEASLWITGPTNLGRHSAIRPVPSRPELKITTSHDFAPLDERTLTEGTPSDSATDSESESKIQRHRSFVTKRGQWHVRPEPGELYDNLDALFPKIDLDKPIIEPHPLSTPSTPALDSPKIEIQPPPVHPTRAGDLRLPQSPKLDPHDRMPPPIHPARPNLLEEIKEKEAKEKEKAKFNKQENRKSIRYIAQDWKRKTLNRQKHDPKDKEAAAKAAAEEKQKLERRKSSSMWGHKVVEVTPSKLQSGQVGTIPESPSSEYKPATLTWVKGELIGKGSYGRVYIALNVTTGDMMAVKQVELPATERDREDRRQLGMVEALQSEIALLKDLYHPNIVQYLGTETSPEYLSIFLEYVPGGTIASIYRTPNQAAFEEQLVKFFTAQILEGLAYLHNKHIWHRDLKGDNILVDAAGVCKISDFGISKQAADAYDSFGQATNMKGSVFWMAPEVIHSVNERTYSGKVDIWSLGCVVLEMWTGTRPWGAMEQVAAMFELFNKRARPPLPPGMKLSPVALDFLNEKCLAKDPRDRPTARELLKHDFITDSDPKWTFAESRIGKAVGRRAKSAKTVPTPGTTSGQ